MLVAAHLQVVPGPRRAEPGQTELQTLPVVRADRRDVAHSFVAGLRRRVPPRESLRPQAPRRTRTARHPQPGPGTNDWLMCFRFLLAANASAAGQSGDDFNVTGESLFDVSVSGCVAPHGLKELHPKLLRLD